MICPLIAKNIIRNRKNSFAVTALIGAVSFLFFLGNSLLRSSERGLREAYIEGLTGDLVIEKAGDITWNLFSANAPVIEDYFVIPPLPAHELIREVVLEEDGVAGFSSLVSGKAWLDIFGHREAAPLCGIDPGTYFSVLPGLVLVEGRFLEPGEYGAMISAAKADRIEVLSGSRPVPGTSLLLSSGGEAGFKIREIPLAGIYRRRNSDEFMDSVILADIQTVRVLASIQTASSDMEAGEEARELLSSDPDSLFEGGGFLDISEGSLEEGLSPAGLRDMLAGEGGGEDRARISGGDWNFIILRLEPGVPPARVMASLNKKLKLLGAAAVDWRIAAGPRALLLFVIRVLFNAGVFLVSVAGIIAAVNILLISVFKRHREIGTLRVLGARDGFIRRLVLGENLVLASAAGLLALLGGFLFFRLVNALGIPVPNALLASLFGGDVLRLVFSPAPAVSAFALAVSLGIAASLYPVEIAVRVDPAAAVRRG